jgi:hypothetical protein
LSSEQLLGFLGWIYLVCHHGGYFNLGGEIAYEGDEKRLLNLLDYWPQDTPLPTILFRKFVDGSPPPFKWGLIKRKRKGSEGGWCVILVFIETDLTEDLLNQPRLFKRRYLIWALEDTDNIGAVLEKLRELGYRCEFKGHIGIILRALELSDELTRWLRGGVGWTAGPKPNIAVHDFAEGFQPQWKRKPLTPEMLVK